MTNITPNAYDRLFELGITSDDYTRFFSGKQSPYIAEQISQTPIVQRPDSFETQPQKKKFDINTAKKIGFIALVGVLTVVGIKKSKNIMNQLRKTGVYKGLMKFFKKTPKVPTP